MPAQLRWAVDIVDLEAGAAETLRDRLGRTSPMGDAAIGLPAQCLALIKAEFRHRIFQLLRSAAIRCPGRPHFGIGKSCHLQKIADSRNLAFLVTARSNYDFRDRSRRLHTVLWQVNSEFNVRDQTSRARPHRNRPARLDKRKQPVLLLLLECLIFELSETAVDKPRHPIE